MRDAGLSTREDDNKNGENMTIEIGEHPESDSKEAEGYNKYLEKNGEGFRGIIIARNRNHAEAILVGDSREGLIKVKEKTPGQWPVVVGTVKQIPKGWELAKASVKKRLKQKYPMAFKNKA